jgi:hypothetical protein
MKVKTILPEVTLLYNARTPRLANAVGVGDFWYEPEVWTLPLPPAAKVLYAGLCSFLGHGQVNRKDLRGTSRTLPTKRSSQPMKTSFITVSWCPQTKSWVAASFRATGSVQ